MNRHEFLRSVSGVVAAAVAAPVASLLESCTPSGYIIQAPVNNYKATILLKVLPDLTKPNSFAKVYAGHAVNPIVLWREPDGEYKAILTTCSHNGCEVRKLRNGFECPCHGSEYDLHGNVVRGPAAEPLESFPVEIGSDRIEIVLEGPA
jgi:Rieske Fe-S protein